MVPAPVVAYIYFMNAVDKLDQVRSCNNTLRKERRVSMSVFSWVLDAVLLNTHVVVRRLDPDCAMTSFKELKTAVVQALIAPWMALKATKASLRGAVKPDPAMKTCLQCGSP
jgi:hypothetical protein